MPGFLILKRSEESLQKIRGVVFLIVGTMDKKKIKRIITREGLIAILFFIIIFCGGSMIMRQALERKYYSTSKPQTFYEEFSGYKEKVVLPIRDFEKTVLLPTFFALYGLYLTFRFIIRAVRTLKGK
jgi:hypothetical protein